MTRPAHFDLIAMNNELATRNKTAFPWDLVDSSDKEPLEKDAVEISTGRHKEQDALMQQAFACWDAQQRLKNLGLFSAWIESQTNISRRQAYRMCACWERLGHYHKNARAKGQTSPLQRFDYGTILYLLSDEERVPNQLLNELLQQTIELINEGKELAMVSRRSIADGASRFKIKKSREGAQVKCWSDSQPLPENQHLERGYQDPEKQKQKLIGAALPAVTPSVDKLKDEQGKEVPTSLEQIFSSREHFKRIRQQLTDLAREIHALTHSPAGRDLHRNNSQRLLSVAEDLNLACPSLVEWQPRKKTHGWACAKTLIRRTYSHNHRVRQLEREHEREEAKEEAQQQGYYHSSSEETD